ncbi:MAG: hypothetical protein AAB697_02000 [Patescibacteria group bacterium]
MGKTVAVGGLLLLAGIFLGGGWLLKNKINSKHETLNPKQVTIATPEPTIDASAQKLTLTVTSPLDGVVVKAAAVTIKGKTAPKADVSVNDIETKADSVGNFSAVVKLDEGQNYVVVIAVGEDGEFAKLELVVTSETFE